MKPFAIRLKLTLWYFVLFFTAATILSLTSWWMLRRTIDSTMLQDLRERADDVVLQIQLVGPHPDPVTLQSRLDATYRYRDDGKWLRVEDSSGKLLYQSQRMAALNQSLSADEVAAGKELIRDSAQSRHRVRTMATRRNVGSEIFLIETGISMTKPSALLYDFGVCLLLLTPLVVLLSATGGHFMSRKALDPVNRITLEARRITDKNLDTRLVVSSAGDELSLLSATLNNMLARIDAAFQSEREFTANASHELRTPLARMRTEVEIALLRPRSAEEYRDTLENLSMDTLEVSGLLDNLLALARAENGSHDMRLAPVDLRAVIDESFVEWTPISQRLSIQLKTAFTGTREDQPLLIMGDRLSLARLLRILLDNAHKFTPSGGCITIDANVAAGMVVLAVEDSGIGISSDHHERIFHRFYRVNGDRSQDRSGFGLGLSLAAWIAGQHGTRVVVSSQPGCGSRFEISFAELAGSTQEDSASDSKFFRSEQTPRLHA